MAKKNAFQRFVDEIGVKELAHQLRCSEAAVYRWYRGERVPRWETIKQLSDLTNNLTLRSDILGVEDIVRLTGWNRKPREV